MLTTDTRQILNSCRTTDCEIAATNEWNNSLGSKFVLIAQALGQALGKNYRLLHGGRCNDGSLFIDMVLRNAQIELPGDGHFDLYRLKLELLRHPRQWCIVYSRIHDEETETFHARFTPQDGDIAIWDNKRVRLAGILEATFDKRGNILYLSPQKDGLKYSFEYRSLDWLLMNGRYGVPDLIMRKR